MTEPAAGPRPPLLRGTPRVLAGVCAGLAVHLGLPVKVVRGAMVVSALLGGAGVLLYLWLWLLVPSVEDAAREADREAAGRAGLRLGPQARIEANGPQARLGASMPPARFGAGTLGSKEILVGAALLLLAGLLAAQAAGVDVAWHILWPVLAVLAGAVIAWLQLDAVSREGLRRRAGATGAAGVVRLAAGLGLVVAGLVVLVSGAVPWEDLWAGLAVALAVLAGVSLVALPFAVRTWRGFVSERSARIRAAERAEIAAHLHDSVLQTLALIQKRAGDEVQVVRLARAQERELRQWLYTDGAAPEGEICEAIRAAAAELEDSRGAVIDVVAVGSLTGLPGYDALLQAAREAMLNAVKHAGGTVSVYVEAGPAGVDVFIRDRGPGFDPDTVAEDRLGVRESIVGRMRRHGGTATIRSGDGTEIRLHMPMEGDTP
ncbi:histidine kinase [Zafaria cholistanensis]|uniref:Histidine kinase n=1 Tax=Zafaria cholistanensis TaxID=1682741 RepID=A0A5A7NND0_9MICC|nr:ATP-binding protein [Zafaria cholistanensis]GER21567.1 histidine kinase [Zafaria cholistanensis]